MKFDMQQRIKSRDFERSMEDSKDSLTQLQDKPKEIIFVKLLESAIKERCGTGENGDLCYERPVELFPVGENQEINLAIKKNWAIPIEQEVRVAEDFIYMNSIQLKKLLLANNIAIPEQATREQLIDLLVSHKS